MRPIPVEHAGGCRSHELGEEVLSASPEWLQPPAVSWPHAPCWSHGWEPGLGWGGGAPETWEAKGSLASLGVSGTVLGYNYDTAVSQGLVSQEICLGHRCRTEDPQAVGGGAEHWTQGQNHRSGLCPWPRVTELGTVHCCSWGLPFLFCKMGLF